MLIWFNSVNETDAALWAMIELNLWVFVASIPAFRPVIGRIIRRWQEKHALKPNASGAMTSLSRPVHPRILPPKRVAHLRSSNPSGMTDQSLHSSDTSRTILGQTGDERLWTASSAGQNGEDDIQLAELSEKPERLAASGSHRDKMGDAAFHSNGFLV